MLGSWQLDVGPQKLGSACVWPGASDPMLTLLVAGTCPPPARGWGRLHFRSGQYRLIDLEEQGWNRVSFNSRFQQGRYVNGQPRAQLIFHETIR